MILTHLGFPPPFINWIMCCIISATFSVLINGSTSHFFHAERGLRQGCPLSPLLFLIVMEALSKLLTATKREGLLHGLHLNALCHLTHLLFVDDVLIFLDGSQRDSSTFPDILKLFAKATGMETNHSKSTITLSFTSPLEASPLEARNVAHLFPFQQHLMEDGLKYLGFRLKPHSYHIADWIWLVTKVEKRLKTWNHRFLSRAGQLVLIKSVLEATPMYWMTLAWIPRGILAHIQQIYCRFLWNGYKEGKPYAWVGWKQIALPKSGVGGD